MRALPKLLKTFAIAVSKRMSPAEYKKNLLALIFRLNNAFFLKAKTSMIAGGRKIIANMTIRIGTIAECRIWIRIRLLVIFDNIPKTRSWRHSVFTSEILCKIRFRRYNFCSIL